MMASRASCTHTTCRQQIRAAPGRSWLGHTMRDTDADIAILTRLTINALQDVRLEPT